MDRIGILAGGGRLPVMIAESVVARGGSVHIVGIEGEADQDLTRFPHTLVNWGQIGRMVATLRAESGSELVIAGSVRRPDLWKLRPDAGLVRSLPQIVGLLAGGDDSVLSRVVRFFEGKGFTVRGAHQVAPALVAQCGRMGTAALSEPRPRGRGAGLCRARGARSPRCRSGGRCGAGTRAGDRGRGRHRRHASAHRGAARGQARAASRRAHQGAEAGPGAARRHARDRVQRTVELAAGAGLAGVAVEAGSVLMLGREMKPSCRRCPGARARGLAAAGSVGRRAGAGHPSA